jgi:hypothetical protein
VFSSLPVGNIIRVAQDLRRMHMYRDYLVLAARREQPKDPGAYVSLTIGGSPILKGSLGRPPLVYPGHTARPLEMSMSWLVTTCCVARK